MPEIDVPLFNGVYKNIDATVAKDQSFKMMDAILDEGPSLFSRPGLGLRVQAASGFPIDGLFRIETRNILVFVTAGDVYLCDIPTGSLLNLSSISGNKINIGVRPTFAYDGTRVFVANGGRIYYYDWSTPGLQIVADAQAPTTCTHIFIFDSYLIANDNTTDTWYFSEPGDALVWNALDFATAESKPDKINSALSFRSEIYFFGRESSEVWENDGETPFVKINGGNFDTGCIAPYSPVLLDDAIMWLSHERRFVKFGGGDVEKISTQYDKELSKFTVVSDCTSDRYDILGKTLIVFQFPSEQRTIVYNVTNNNWGEFGYWNSAGGFYEPFLGACHAYVPESGLHIVGSRKADGKLLYMSDEVLTDDSNQIRMLTESGHINYGTNNKKRNEFLTIRVKRGYITDDSTPVATMSLQNDNGVWGNEIPFSLGKIGDYFNTVRLPRLGQFRTRKYRFVCSDPVGFVFSEAKEEVTVMDR